MIPPQLIILLHEPFGGSLTEIIVIKCGLDHIVKQWYKHTKKANHYYAQISDLLFQILPIRELFVEIHSLPCTNVNYLFRNICTIIPQTL